MLRHKESSIEGSQAAFLKFNKASTLETYMYLNNYAFTDETSGSCPIAIYAVGTVPASASG